MVNDELAADEKKVLSLYRKLRAQGDGDLRVYVKRGILSETHVREIETQEDIATKGIKHLKESTDDLLNRPPI